MSDYSLKLQSIATKKQKLLEEETHLIQKRKSDIANLAERFNLLTVSDPFLAGIFNEAQTLFQESSARCAEVEKDGARFLKPHKHPSSPSEKISPSS